MGAGQVLTQPLCCQQRDGSDHDQAPGLRAWHIGSREVSRRCRRRPWVREMSKDSMWEPMQPDRAGAVCGESRAGWRKTAAGEHLGHHPGSARGHEWQGNERKSD